MAAELVGGALLSSFLQVILDRLVSRQVLDYFRGRKLDEKLLHKLKVKLLSINSVTDDAEQKQIQNPCVREWLLEVKDVVLDAEDLFDEIHYEALKCELEVESQTTAVSKVRNFFHIFSVSSFDKEIESRMKQVLDSLDFLSNQKGNLGLKEARGVRVGSAGSSRSQKLPSTSLLVESVIYGRDDDKEMIFNWLTSDTDNHNHISILSIVGMGGVGKTTLAQHVYNDPRMEEAKFDVKAWVCVSDDFDVLAVTGAILQAITRSKEDSGDLEMVHGRLKENLTGKRFLLVLDDVWNERREKWEVVQTPLNHGAQGSRILVTTRSTKVASTMRSNKVHHLKHLQQDNCWQVFANHAFQDDSSLPNGELKELGVKIVEKCKGLPLALKTIGSLLRTKLSISEWESVLVSKTWDLPKEDSEIIPALLLSYNHLPSHLKRCFAYCALFPKDYQFDKKSLILLWMAENFLPCPLESKNVEEAGEQYFDDLLSRSFFQQSCMYTSYFVMHDLLNDLAKYVCGDICFRLEVDKLESIPKSTRHFLFMMRSFDGLENLYDAKRLRTFMQTNGTKEFFYDRWHCKMSIYELLSKLKYLRILSLSGCSDLTEVPDSIGDLKHLRSLNPSNTSIKRLPDSTCSLYNLQILNLNFCVYLDELPLNLHKLANLRRLEFIHTCIRNMPTHLGKLKNLQVLSSFYVGKSTEFGIQQLGELNLHESLTIQDLENTQNPFDALAADLKNKMHLVGLDLHWSWNRNSDDSTKERDVFENLQPSKHLKNLSISYYDGTQFPSWLSNTSLLNMVHLTLSYCKNCLCLPSLGLLPFLQILTMTGLNGIVSIDADFYGISTSSFTSLESLHFKNMKEWEEWKCNAVRGAFPRLQFLSIVGCPKLKGQLPEQLLHLKSLEIYGCEQLVASAPKALEMYRLELQDCGKLQFDYHPTTLNHLTIRGACMEASSLKSIEHIISNTSLRFLIIDSCLNMNIPMGHSYDFLISLKICGSCDSLTTFPLDFFPQLYWLDIRCRYLQMISQERTHDHLKKLDIRRCPQFESFPGEGLSAPQLERFSIEGLENLKSLPERMHVLLPSLDNLQIKDCPTIESFPDEGLPPSLTRVKLSNCYKLITSLKEALGDNTSLKELTIGELEVESFPDPGLLPLCVKLLKISNSPNLQKLDYKGLYQLSSLEELILDECSSLQCLPEQGLPKSISTLNISSTLRISGNHQFFKQSCLEPKGEDWGKISHTETDRGNIVEIETSWVRNKPTR